MGAMWTKGDILSKALVAFQTTWFVFECLTRLQQKLPALWWYKPLNVLRPIYLHIQETPEDWAPGQIDYVEDDGWWKSMWGRFIKRPFLAATSMILQLFGVVVYTEIQAEEKRDGMVARGREAVGRMVDAIKEDVGRRPWWKTVWKRLMKQPFLAVAWPLWELFNDVGVENGATHVSTFYGMGISREKGQLVIQLSCFIGTIFGAIHFLSWHSTFPTHAELLLWRISSIVLVVQPALLPLFPLLDKIYRRTPYRLWRASITKVLSQLFWILSVFVGPIPYILARFCVLILAFLTLNHLPPRALDSITWTFYIPHL